MKAIVAKLFPISIFLQNHYKITLLTKPKTISRLLIPQESNLAQ